jgi:hypothetical protein
MSVTQQLTQLAQQLQNFANALVPTVQALNNAGNSKDGLAVFQAETHARFASMQVASSAVAGILQGNTTAVNQLTATTNDLNAKAAKIAADQTKVAKIVGIAAAALQLATAVTGGTVSSIITALQGLSGALN